jgi:hypothetical protein
MKVVEVSQFFQVEDMSWEDLIRCDEKGVLPSTSGKVFLWTETPKIKEVSDKYCPTIGNVWYIDKGGKPIVWKANYDTSD